MGLEGPVRARADGRSVADRAGDSLGIRNGDALAPENMERLRLPRRAARASGSFVKEVKRRLVEAPAILLGNGDEGVALGMYELAPTVNLLVGAGIGGHSWQGSAAVGAGGFGYDTGDKVDEGLGAGG